MTTDLSTPLLQQLSLYRARVENTLQKKLPDSSDKLMQAMRYATLNGGKRLRPILVYVTGECFGQSLNVLDPIAAAIECIHCYSLIHDDLPAMDDDDLRRGQPTCHISFDEATAILAGDALQTLAFDFLSSHQHLSITTNIQIQMIRVLSHQSGLHGMVGGQSLDLNAEGKTLSENELKQIHQLKTGALIQAAVQLGAIAAGCQNTQTLSQLNAFASYLGLAFQLQDDLLDVSGHSSITGKNTGQDTKQHKATYAITLGVSTTEKRINTLIDNALSLLKALPHDTTQLEALCTYLAKREC